MTEIANYPEIRKRMLGDLKPKPKPEQPRCLHCNDAGWIALARSKWLSRCGMQRVQRPEQAPAAMNKKIIGGDHVESVRT